MIATHEKFGDYLLGDDASVKDALSLIDKNESKIAFIINAENQLVGTVTDGDIRRGLLNGYDASSCVKDIMNTRPHSLNDSEEREHIFQFMRSNRIRHVPIVSDAGKITDIVTMDDMIIPHKKDNWVVIMAGGLGKRLHPLTEDTPKPMLKVAGVPVVEHLIGHFISQGFHRFYLSINYLGYQIKEHFGDGERLGIEIRYLEEDMPLNTAGSLSLIKEKPKDPFVVINGDIITNVNFSDMLDFHLNNEAKATMGVREYTMDVPYGVVELNDCDVAAFKEKPKKTFFVNTGIYVLNPCLLDLIQVSKPLAMPILLMEASEDKDYAVKAFPVREHWLDIGRIEDFSRAESLVHEIAAESA